MAYSNSRERYIYAKKESTFGTAVAVLAANACRIIECSMNPNIPDIERPDIQPDLSPAETIKGRYGPNPWSVRMSLAANGVAGTKPDNDPFLECAFGTAATVVAATSVTYNLNAASPTLSIYDYRDPSTMDQRVAISAIVQRMRIEFGGDAPILTFSGDCFNVLSSAAFSSYETAGKGGLGSVSARPASPVTNGYMAPGFMGSISIGGNSYTTLRTGFIDIDFARELPRRSHNNRFATAPERDVRVVTGELMLDDDDSANLNAVKATAITKSKIALAVGVGETAGNIWTFNAPKILCAVPDYDQSQRRSGVRFSFRAYPSALGALDEINCAIT